MTFGDQAAAVKGETAAEAFRATLEDRAQHFERVAKAYRAAAGFGSDPSQVRALAALYDDLARRCRERADEAKMTGAASFEELEDRMEAWLSSPPRVRSIRFVPRPTRSDPGSTVFDPDAAAGWPDRA